MNNDHQLKTDVLAELAFEPTVSADHIGVTARDGVVTLSGHVESYWQKLAAETAAGRVKGVKAIAEEIEVRMPLHIKRSDDEIAAAAVNRIAWDVSVPSDAVKIKVEKGFVTLTGTVDQHYQKDAAAWSIQSLMGVTGIANQIAVKPKVDTSTISEDIRHALHRTWFSPNNIKVSATEGKVHLTGKVDTWRERELAAATAWAAAGTSAVSNDIRIG
jgi:osmotically-inducible protein OsmY